ncbi:MarR family winged helix-turn-helix transcriptional regulator [Aeromicrobium sp. CTD01-1L150]|uniref:MarR family winged helix-turn-helix transcriptional regulator n=1 Tax=Aeromicrobium sp. CTD01-1L150 TaxID=3341830 RepID=UPI0035BF2BA3
MPTDTQNLAMAVARLNRRLRQERQSDLTPTQLSVLGTVSQLGPTSPSAVAARERVSAPSVTRTLNCLVEDGHVTREPHPDDGRQVVVSLSDTGAKVLEEERQRRDAWLHRRLRELDPRERALLREASALLTRIAES